MWKIFPWFVRVVVACDSIAHLGTKIPISQGERITEQIKSTVWGEGRGWAMYRDEPRIRIRISLKSKWGQTWRFNLDSFLAIQREHVHYLFTARDLWNAKIKVTSTNKFSGSQPGPCLFILQSYWACWPTSQTFDALGSKEAQGWTSRDAAYWTE